GLTVSAGAITLTPLGAGVVLSSGTGVLSSVAGATAGQVLTSNGAGVAPTFQTAAGTASNVVILTTGATSYTKSAGTLAILIECVGGGGGGGGAQGNNTPSASAAGGGGSGAYSVAYLSPVIGPYTVSIGAAGAGGNGTGGGGVIRITEYK